ncbi:MAG: Zn-dependent oligopeptidase [Candidatus Eremiobacteraeota bacterium]|nr:Zn-dependent oligopeptidase [Candidatus Eremiobacteraeota bacterium]MBV8499986.1 Zn-dependent oligopeptidase [Candidatus Eremiobacteraeota bacterium]
MTALLAVVLALGGSTMTWNLSAQGIQSSCTAAIQAAKKSLDALATARVTPTLSNTLLPLENLNADLGDRLVAQTFLWQVSPDTRVRAASLDCSNAVADFSEEAAAVPAIYAALKRIDPAGLPSDADRALLRVWLDAYRRSGAGLPDAARTEFVALSKQLTTLQNDFVKNVSADTTALDVSKGELDGVPADFVASLKGAANGAVVLPVNASSVSIVLANAANEGVRRRVYMAFTNIQYPGNVVLLQKAIRIRYRLAHLLGFSSWAAYQMADRTVTDPQKIDAFLADLDRHLRSRASSDIATLAALKARQLGVPTAAIQAWDVAYYLAQLQKTKYAVDRNEVRRYFPAPHVVSAVLRIYEHLLGLKFTPITPANAWAPAVSEYGVSDAATGRFIGSFYLDLYPREGKTDGAYNAPLLEARRNADGSARPPVSALVVGDWPMPLGGKPALLTHEDVTTFFHEFGHCMAALLATVPYESIASFGQDFVEAPSQMLENFTWDPAILEEISSNVDTGAPIPADLVKRLIAARCTSDRLCNAYAATRQILLSDVDLRYHEGAPDMNLTTVWDEVAALVTPVPTPAGAHPVAAFTHIMGGYDAGYYVYLWSLVYAQDMFTAFAAGGLDNPEVGMRYRTTILQPAYTYDADREVRDFLGRPMSPAAFYRGFGIDSPN